MTDYPFHTAEVDGEVICGIVFNIKEQRFYEFVDPSEHDDYARYRDPRDGDLIIHDTVINEAVGLARALERFKVRADEWSAFRETYIESEADNLTDWMVEHGIDRNED